MPAKPKTKRATNPSMKGKREAIIKVFGGFDAEAGMEDFLYSRRHLATDRDPTKRGRREPKYIGEYYELEEAIEKTLGRIHARDGAKIFKEVSDLLLSIIATEIEHRTGPKGLRRAMRELKDDADGISGRSARVRKAVAAGDRAAIAA
jgi:hypothetical protein